MMYGKYEDVSLSEPFPLQGGVILLSYLGLCTLFDDDVITDAEKRRNMIFLPCVEDLFNVLSILILSLL